MAAVAAAFAAVIGAGFWMHQRTNAISGDIFGTIAALKIAALAGLILCAMWGLSPWKYLARTINSFGAKPIRRPSVQPRESAAQIAYAENRDATAACVHLQPIEHAMRAAGIDLRLLEISEYAPVVKAVCRINKAALKPVFALSSSIYYREGYQPERSPWDNPRADIFCGEALPPIVHDATST